MTAESVFARRRQRWILRSVCLCLFVACAAASFSCSSFSIPGEAAIHADELGAEYYAIGEEWMTAKKYQRAVIWYEKARAFPDYANAATLQLARAYAFMGDWSGSSREYETLLASDPLNTSLLSSYAYVVANLGDTMKALDIYKGLVEKNEFDSTLLKNYITLLSLTGDFDAARKELEVMKKLYPDSEAATSSEKRIADEEAKLKAAAEAASQTETPSPAETPKT